MDSFKAHAEVEYKNSMERAGSSTGKERMFHLRQAWAWEKIADAENFVVRCARRATGASNGIPVEIIDGDSAPRYEGNHARYTTRGGTIIDHPSAYSSKGWSNMVYHRSTLRVVVGRDWRP